MQDSLNEVLASAITQTGFTATGLQTGSKYNVKVQARNVFGYSDYSASLEIMCAEEPATPIAPITTR